jgi:hypothetical protein
MADIYQGKINTISPAIGSYNIQTYISIDRGITGAGDMGVTGNYTLEPLVFEQGLTGVNGSSFNNLKSGHNF